jgi:hypothetical protein
MCGRAPFPVSAAQCISHPPSTLKAAPVIFSARSEARKAAISPMSFGVWNGSLPDRPPKMVWKSNRQSKDVLDPRKEKSTPN